MTKKLDPFYDHSLNETCPITSQDVLDDCHISIEFRYGSDKDMTTYTFSPVHDEVGKKVLAYIQSLMPQGHSVEEFAKDVMADLFEGGDKLGWSDEDKKDNGL